MITSLFIIFSLLTPKIPDGNMIVKQGDIIEISSQKALVFQVDKNGEHGIAMCIKALRGVDSPWGTNARMLKELPIMTDKDGKANTEAAMSYAESHDCLMDFPILKWCKQLGDGWYIPSSKELEGFINYWLGNTRVMDWDDEEESEVSDQAYYNLVNHKLLDAGGIPFMSGVYTSTFDETHNFIYIFEFQRFWKREKLDNSWSIEKVKTNSVGEKHVGRAFIRF